MIRSPRKQRGLRANAAVLTLGLVLAAASVAPAGAIESVVDAPCPTGPTVANDPYSMRNIVLATGADKYWANGYYGQGIDIAIIDTGVEPVKGLTTQGKVVHGPDLSFDASVDDLAHHDGFGHGTHLAGIIAGRDDGALRPYVNDKTRFIGVAPEARIISVKVGDSNGAVDVTQMIAGIDWVIEHQRKDGLNIKVLNLSFGTNSTLKFWSDPLAYAAERAWKAGIVVVTAAGNDGHDTSSATGLGLTSPAYSPLLIAVGAADTMGTIGISDDRVAEYTSSSTSTAMRYADFVAPGSHVPSLAVCGSGIEGEIAVTRAVAQAAIDTPDDPAVFEHLVELYGREYALDYFTPDPMARLMGTDDIMGTPYVGDRFVRGSGSSQAAAVVSGAVALMLSGNSKITPDDVKSALRKSAERLKNGSQTQQGDGEINLATAMTKLTLGNNQNIRLSDGGGSLDASRGGPGSYLVSEQLVTLWGNTYTVRSELSGERDIFGTAVDTKVLASYEAFGSGYGGWKKFWNLQPWGDASGWYTDPLLGKTWGGRGHWTGASFSGAAWSSDNWSGARWTGARWTGARWTGARWTGARWTGARWTGARWTGARWVSSGWR